MEDRVLRHYQRVPFKQDTIDRHTFKMSLTYYILREYNFESKWICDIGCSYSFVGNFIKFNYPQYKYVGIDMNFRAVKSAHAKKINVLVGDNKAIPLQSGCSDLTICEGVLHYNENYKECLKELIRITKKGGYISLLTYNKSSYYFYFYNICKPIRVIYQYHRKLSKSILLKTLFFLYRYFIFLFSIFLGIQERVPMKEILSSFHNQILIPVIYFRSKDEIMVFANNNGLELLKFKKKFFGRSLLFLFQRVK